ncbi:MAG TPA: S24 family peptidase [Sporichthyaceae bacterium]|jgi:phage repressor protein C with HTH and peptisase S24 domain
MIGATRRGVQLVRVAGESMLPTLRDGDLLLVRKGAPVPVGRLVIVRLPDGTTAVKRAVHRVPEGWWVERDNASAGVDSWQVGAIAPVDVLGVVVARIWPWRRRL